MDLWARLTGGGRGRHLADGERCKADWRRPDGYWRCARAAGHRGRHRMRPDTRRDGAALGGEPGRRRGEGGIAAG